jgi:hypothetical protein
MSTPSIQTLRNGICICIDVNRSHSKERNRGKRNSVSFYYGTLLMLNAYNSYNT